MNSLPPVGVVIPTHDRPQLLLRTLDAVLAQDYSGPITALVVFDKNTPDEFLTEELRARGVGWVPNARTPGLAGARNTGSLELTHDLIAFCDDDDVWHRDKLKKQLELLAENPEAHVVTCGMRVIFRDKSSERLAGAKWIDHASFVRSRMAMVHSSTLVFRRDFLIDIGLVDEGAPSGQNEDWDLLLRATERGSLLNVDEALVDVLWGTTSFFTYAYESKIDSLHWILANHPEITQDRKGYSRVLGQIGYWEACLGNTDEARHQAFRSLRQYPAQWRAALALGVSWKLISGERALRVLHRFGRGV